MGAEIEAWAESSLRHWLSFIEQPLWVVVDEDSQGPLSSVLYAQLSDQFSISLVDCRQLGFEEALSSAFGVGRSELAPALAALGQERPHLLLLQGAETLTQEERARWVIYRSANPELRWLALTSIEPANDQLVISLPSAAPAKEKSHTPSKPMRPVKPESASPRRAFPLVHIGALLLLFALLLNYWMYHADDVSLTASTAEEIAVAPVTERAAQADPSSSAVEPTHEPENTVIVMELPTSTAADVVRAIEPVVVPRPAVESVRTMVEEPAALPNASPSTTVERPIDAGLSADEVTVLAWDGNRYALQLMGALEEVRVLELQRRFAGQPILVVEKLYHNKIMYLALLGSYADRDAATRALKQLPAELVGLQPWARRVASVQQDIRERRAL